MLIFTHNLNSEGFCLLGYFFQHFSERKSFTVCTHGEFTGNMYSLVLKLGVATVDPLTS